ncbi:MAG: hypothetical protein AB7W47_14070 [Calditrichaceae bacterium]
MADNMIENSGQQYEKQDINISKIIGYAVAIIVLLASILVFLNEYFVFARENLVFEKVLKPESIELREIRAAEEKELNTYKLLDAENGIYQIPIERAIQVIADETYESRLKQVKSKR